MWIRYCSAVINPRPRTFKCLSIWRFEDKAYTTWHFEKELIIKESELFCLHEIHESAPTKLKVYKFWGNKDKEYND